MTPEIWIALITATASIVGALLGLLPKMLATKADTDAINNRITECRDSDKLIIRSQIVELYSTAEGRGYKYRDEDMIFNDLVDRYHYILTLDGSSNGFIDDTVTKWKSLSYNK